MKPLLFLFLFSLTSVAQIIQNPDFETPRDTLPALPVGWRVDQRPGFTVSLDSTVVKSGRRSLKIASVADPAVSSGGFSQSARVQLSGPMLVHLRGFIKTDNPAGVGVWWNSWRDEKHRGFAHSDEQVILRQADGWQPLDLVLPTSADINRFTFGAYLHSRGSVWFDDLRFETTPVGAGEPSAKVKAYIQKVISLVKKHALVRDSIPWTQTEAEMLVFARGMQTEKEVYPIVSHLLNVMRQYGDKHSHFLPPSEVKNLEADESDDKALQPQARYLGNGVGYIAVPGFSGINDKRQTAFARQIQQLLKCLDTTQTVTSWVVDLRQNEGGNLYPMIAGLGPLLGDGRLGYFIEGKHAVAWGYRNGNSYDKKRGVVTRVPAPYRLRQARSKVAVLIGSRTASSGEMTAISFIGRANTRFFGLPTGSYTTSNQDYKLPDGAFLLIASSVAADRLGRQHLKGIVPDEPIKEESTAVRDPTLEAAKAWLTKR